VTKIGPEKTGLQQTGGCCESCCQSN